MTSRICNLSRPGRHHLWALTLGLFAMLASPPAAAAEDMVLGGTKSPCSGQP